MYGCWLSCLPYLYQHIEQGPVVVEKGPQKVGHGESDVLPVAFGEDIALLRRPLIGGFEATGEHALNTESGPWCDVVAEFFEGSVPAVIDGEELYGRALRSRFAVRGSGVKRIQKSALHRDINKNASHLLTHGLVRSRVI